MTTITTEFTPTGAGLDLFLCRDLDVLMSGPAGTGKSRTCLEKVHACMLANPGASALLVRKQAVDLTTSTLRTFDELVIPAFLEAGVITWYGGSKSEPAQYRYPGGARIVVGGLDKASRIMSTEYDLIFVDEATELAEDDWEKLRSRLRHGVMSFQQIIGACNPDQPTHWLYQRTVTGSTRIFESRHRDNPAYVNADGSYTELGASYIEGNLSTLTGVRKQRLLDGLWVAAEGMVYEGWDPAVHVVEFEVQPDWTRFLSIDWGWSNPQVIQWWAEDPDGRLYLYRESYRTKHHPHLAGDLVASMPDAGDIWQVVCDHDPTDRETFSEHSGLPTRAAKKDVASGIRVVQARLQVQDDGLPRLFIHPHALIERDPELVRAKKPTSTLEEVTGYVWDRSSVAKREKEAPVKENDHGMDAMRYMCMHRARPGETTLEFAG